MYWHPNAGPQRHMFAYNFWQFSFESSDTCLLAVSRRGENHLRPCSSSSNSVYIVVAVGCLACATRANWEVYVQTLFASRKKIKVPEKVWEASVQSRVRLTRICGHLTHGTPAKVCPALGLADASEKIVKIKCCGCWGYHRSLFCRREGAVNVKTLLNIFSMPFFFYCQRIVLFCKWRGAVNVFNCTYCYFLCQPSLYYRRVFLWGMGGPYSLNLHLI